MPEQTSRSGERTDEDREIDAFTDLEIWEEAKDRLKIASDAYESNREKAKEAMLFREGDQWDQSAYNASVSQDEPELTINLTDAFVNRVVNNIKQQRPKGKCHPVGDGADVEKAQIINGIGRHVEVRSEASVAYDMAAEHAVTGGEGYFRLIAEYESPESFRKDMRILPIRNPFTVYMDPAAVLPSGADQMWCIISTKMKRIEYKRRYPKASNAQWVASNDKEILDWEDKEEVRLAEYFRIREMADTLFLLRDRMGHETTIYKSDWPKGEDGRRVSRETFVKQLAEQGAFIADERPSVKMQVEWFRLNGMTVVEKQVIPGQYIPVFRVDGNSKDIDGRIYRRGMVKSMMDPARMVNFGEVAKIKRLGLAPKSPWVAAEGQLDGHPEWDDANTVPYSVLTYKPVVIDTASGPVVMPPPQRQPPAQIEAGFADFVQGMRLNLSAVAGMPNEPGVDQQGVVVSGKALSKRQYLSDQAHFQYYDHLTLAIAQCWRVILGWIPHYYSGPRTQRIIGEDSTPQMVQLNQPQQGEEGAVQSVLNDVSVGRYDVVMDTGPGYETKREEGAENLLQMLNTPALAELVAKTGPDLVFRSIDHPYMQELADRLAAANPEGLEKILDGLSDRAKAIVKALANELTAAQQQLQQAQQEIKSGAVLKQMEEAGKKYAVDTKAHTDLTRTLIETHGEMAETEVKAAASLLNTKGEEKLHPQAADDLLHKAELDEGRTHPNFPGYKIRNG